MKEKYETNKGNWENKKIAKRTKAEKDKLRNKIQSHLNSNADSIEINVTNPLNINSITNPLIQNIDHISDRNDSNFNSAINKVSPEPKTKLNKIEANLVNYNSSSRILLDSTNLDSQAASK